MCVVLYQEVPIFDISLRHSSEMVLYHKLFLSFFLSPDATQPIVGVYFTALNRALASSRTRLLDHIQRRATVGRTPLNE